VRASCASSADFAPPPIASTEHRLHTNCLALAMKPSGLVGAFSKADFFSQRACLRTHQRLFGAGVATVARTITLILAAGHALAGDLGLGRPCRAGPPSFLIAARPCLRVALRSPGWGWLGCRRSPCLTPIRADETGLIALCQCRAVCDEACGCLAAGAARSIHSA